MPEPVKNKFFDDKQKYLKGLYTEAVDGWESDRKDWYLENAALANDVNPLNEFVEQGAFAPHVPVITPAIGIRRAEIEALQTKTERPYLIKPRIEKTDEEGKAENEAVIERVYARIEFAKAMSDFAKQMKTWRHNAEIYPASFLYLDIKEVERDVPEEIIEPQFAADPETGEKYQSGENRRYEYKPQTVYVGPCCYALQPEKVLIDPDATSLDKADCRFVGWRKTVSVDYVLEKYQTALDGTEITRELLESKKTEDVERADSLDEQGYGREKKPSGIEMACLWFCILDDTPEETGELYAEGATPPMTEPSNKLRIRKSLFLPQVGEEKKVCLLLEDDWTPYKGKNAAVYPVLAITAEDRPNEIEGHSTVDNGKSSQYEIDDLVRMRLEAGARSIYPKEIVQANNVISPKDRVAHPYERTTVKDINGIRVEAVYNPNIRDFVEEQKLFHEIAMNRMAADAVLPQQTLTSGAGDNETATATNRREAVFNSRLGLTFDIYSGGERDATEWYYEAIKQIYLEGKSDIFEREISGVSDTAMADFVIEDLLLDVRFEVTPFAVLAKRDMEKLLSREFLETLLPLVQASPENPVPMLSPSAILLIEKYWRDNGASEKLLQEFLQPFKDQNAVLAEMEALAAGTLTNGNQPKGAVNAERNIPVPV